MVEQRQEWNDKVIYLIADEYGSVQLELYKDVQDFGGTAWLWDLFVLPGHRRKGHAKRLLKRAEEAARRDGHKSVFLEWCAKDSPSWVLDWYGRQGYETREIGSGYIILEKRFV